MRGSMAPIADTIVAPATPAGTSALAIVRASGPLAGVLASSLSSTPPQPRQAFHAGYQSLAGTLVDDVVAVFFQGPRSYTGEDLLEIYCHGNTLIINALLKDICSRGCRLAEPGEFTRRAFLNGNLDLSQAEAVADLIHAHSERALAAAHRQLRGALGQKIHSFTDRLVDVLAHLEACIDFPEEDIPPADRDRWAQAVGEIRSEVDRLVATRPYGDILRGGVRTVLLGEPNAGKSSLLNRLLGRERALVSPEPGTTRDYLEEPVSLGPHCIRLIDTAGLHASPSPLDKLGVARSLERAADADLILWVVDATRPLPSLPGEVRARLLPATTLVVVNKIDLAPDGPRDALPSGLSCVRVSALTGAGCPDLEAAIVRHADSFRTGPDEDLVAINVRHQQSLQEAARLLDAARQSLASMAPAELLASDIRGAIHSFGEVVGRVDNEQILDRIFAKFCIGK